MPQQMKGSKIMATEVVGLFDTRDAADNAALALERAGNLRSDISVEAYDGNAQAGPSGTGQSSESGWNRMLEKLHLVAPDHERDYYAQGLRPGQTLVSVTTTDDAADSAADILDQQGALDIDEHSAQYYTAQGTTVPAGYRHSSVGAAEASQGTVIPVVEEELAVGKRQVRRGGVRVYQHVAEQPVEQQVTLHEETVTVDRRPVDRAAAEADFRTGDFVVTETAEEAVVAKNARVVEEVVVGKAAHDRTETIRDTVRRTDVEVDQLDTDEMLDEDETPRVTR